MGNYFYDFDLKPASSSIKNSLCTNRAIKCDTCKAALNILWSYNMLTHYKRMQQYSGPHKNKVKYNNSCELSTKPAFVGTDLNIAAPYQPWVTLSRTNRLGEKKWLQKSINFPVSFTQGRWYYAMVPISADFAERSQELL